MASVNQADLLVRNIDWLITVDRERRIIRDAAVAVANGKFAAVGKTDALEREWRAQRVVDGRGAVATPGLIDNHLHSSFHLARGLADEANAQSFLFEHMYPYEAVMAGRGECPHQRAFEHEKDHEAAMAGGMT